MKIIKTEVKLIDSEEYKVKITFKTEIHNIYFFTKEEFVDFYAKMGEIDKEIVIDDLNEYYKKRG